jgi:uncharacterized protein
MAPQENHQHGAGPDLLQEISRFLESSRGLARKKAVGQVARALTTVARPAGWPHTLGEDAAPIPYGEDYLLLAAEGISSELSADPWWAGYCAVLVNVNDICATGGRPLALVNVLRGKDPAWREEILAGMAFASSHFSVPMVGGHVDPDDEQQSVDVCVLGAASRLVTSFGASPGDRICAVVDLVGDWRTPFPHWDSTTRRSPSEIARHLAVLPTLAEQGFVLAGKDVSNPGVLGSLLMLLETSGCGADIDLEVLPRPASVDLRSWVAAYPGFGLVLAVSASVVHDVCSAFQAEGLAAADIGGVTEERRLSVRHSGSAVVIWDLSTMPITGVQQ